MASREGIVDARVQQLTNNSVANQPRSGRNTRGVQSRIDADRQVDQRPTPVTVESLGKVNFKFDQKDADFKRDIGPPNRDYTFPESLLRGGIPYVKLDIFEINSNPGAEVPNTVQSRSAASFTAGAASLFSAAATAAETAGTTASNILGKTITEGATNTAAAAGNLVNAAAQKYNFDPQKFKEKVSTLFKDFSLNRYSDTRVSSITLPIPDGLATQYAQDFGQPVSLTAAFGALGFAAQAMAEPSKLDKNDPYLSELASLTANKLFNTSEDLTNILQFGLSGRVVNPQMEMLYRSPLFREFTFDFRLIPRTQADTAKIYNIIKELKLRSSPTFCGTTTGRYYVPPARFAFTFFDNYGQPNDYLFRSKQCILTNLSVDYAPNGYATHDDGSPVEIRLSMQLQETAMITSEDYSPGGYNY